MGGVSVTVTGTGGENDAAANFTLPHRSVSVWVAAGKAGPAIGSITPRVANAGALMTISGAGFGTTRGQVLFIVGGLKVPAKVVKWMDGEITAEVPSVSAGPVDVVVGRGTASSNRAPFLVATGKLIPVNFSVAGVPALGSGDVVMLTGNLMELGNWSTTWNGADGPAVTPAAGSGLLTVSVPAGAKSQFKFLVLRADGSVQWEGGSNHLYTIPASGVGAVAVNWQP
jgi:hypothetical protein